MVLLLLCCTLLFIFFFKQKTAYEMRISDWSSDVCSSDLPEHAARSRRAFNPDRPAHPFDQALAHHQPDTRALFGAGFLTEPIERLKQTLQQIGRASCRERASLSV